MLIRAYWNFYKELLTFIAAFAVLSILLFGMLWGYLLFITVGLAIGFLGFEVFYKEQYYFYFNLGLTRKKLLIVSFCVNAILGLPILGLLSLLIQLLFGTTSLL